MSNRKLPKFLSISLRKSSLVKFPVSNEVSMDAMISRFFLLGSLAIVATPAFAQKITGDFSVKTPGRLSTFISSESAKSESLPKQEVSLQGMMLNSSSEITQQQKQKDQLLNYLSGLQKPKSNSLMEGLFQSESDNQQTNNQTNKQ
jgi:hypothetical protein